MLKNKKYIKILKNNASPLKLEGIVWHRHAESTDVSRRVQGPIKRLRRWRYCRGGPPHGQTAPAGRRWHQRGWELWIWGRQWSCRLPRRLHVLPPDGPDAQRGRNTWRGQEISRGDKMGGKGLRKCISCWDQREGRWVKGRTQWKCISPILIVYWAVSHLYWTFQCPGSKNFQKTISWQIKACLTG